MLLRVADQLSGLVEAHRLAVEQGDAEHVRVVAFDPGRHINQFGETDGVAFGEAVGAEALDLAKTAPGEILGIAARGHAADEFGAVSADIAVMLEGGHGPTQAVGLLRRELGRLDGQTHGLFLEQRHAVGLAEHALKLIGWAVRRIGRGKVDRLGPLAAAQIRVDHVALDRTGADNGDLDHQIIEFLGLEARQHGHLRAAFHLEHAHGIGVGQHFVDGGIFARDVGHVRYAQHVHGLPDRAEHAERQYIDLHQAQRIDVVLVPFEEGAVFHGGVADGDGLVEPALGQHKAADVLGEMARKAQELAGEDRRAADVGTFRIQARLTNVVVGYAVAPAAPYRFGQSGGDVFGEPQRFSHIADGAARAVMDDGGADRRPLAAIAPVDVLHHLFAPFVLEVDVDIGRLVAFLGDEAGEQHVVLGFGGIDRRDAQAKAHHRIGRRSAPLAEDALGPRPMDDVVHGEEIIRIIELFDQGQFRSQQAFDLVGDRVRIAPGRALPGQIGQMGDGGLARRHGLIGIFVFELAQIKGDARDDLEGLGDGVRPFREQAGHFGGRFDVPLGVGLQPQARFGDRALFADAGQHVLQGAPFGTVIEHVIGRDHRRADLAGQGVQRGDPFQIPRAIGPGRDQPDPARERIRQTLKLGLESLVQARRRHNQDQLAFAVAKQVVDGQLAVALLRATLADGEQAGQPPPRLAVGGIANHTRRPVREVEPAAA